MKIVIDIPEKDWEFLKESDGCRWSRAIIEGVANGTPLPQNATNGDVIKAVFPNEHFMEMYAYVACGFTLFDKNWWNAPYKAESEDICR